MSDDKKIIFSMSGVTKSYQSANTPVLKNIYLSFFYGAKIGILGLNGSGKSTLLKIIAGVDKNYQGDVVFSQDYSVGYLEQEPQLDESKTVMEIVREGAAETVAILDEYNNINDTFTHTFSYLHKISLNIMYLCFFRYPKVLKKYGLILRYFLVI